MQSVVVETVIAALLVILLWSLDRGRSDHRFRFWVFGWSLVPVFLVSQLWHPRAATGQTVQQALFLILAVLSGACFILSDPSVLRTRRRLLHTAYLATFPALLSAVIILFQPSTLWLVYLAITGAHCLAIVLARQYLGRSAARFFPIASLHFLSACWMLGALSSHRPELVLASIPAELFLVNAIAFSRTYSFRTPGSILAVTGLVLWAWSSFVTIALGQAGSFDTLLPNVLNLPPFLVALGMVMVIFEQDGITMRELVLEYELLFNNNPFPLWIYELKSLRILSANAAAAAAHGYTVAELCQKKLTDIIHSDMTSTVLGEIQSPTARFNRYSLHTRKDGSTLPVNITVYDVRFRGRAARIALAEDISEREQMASQLRYQVQHDMLTGLPSREMFLRMLEEIFISATCDNLGCAVIAFQINRFEKVNEKYGHHVGDQLLRQTARLLQSQLHPEDIIARTGSREFTIALASVQNASIAQARAHDLLRPFNVSVVVDGHAIEVSTSMGLAVYPEDSDDTSALLRDAGHARSLAKTRAPDNFVRLSRALSIEAQEESRIEALIHNALAGTGFEVFYQPIADINGELCAMEALLRLYDEDGSIVSPNIFIPIAEATETIIPVGRWVVEDVCRQLHAWQNQGLPVVPVAINVSALQIVQPTFCTDIFSTLARYKIEPALVNLEVTESSVMPRGSLALDNMMELSAAGIRFSIDDFGTGFSSLNRLHQLPVSILKIDRSFVTRMTDADGTLPIVSTIISMAHSLKVGVIAEGVETKEQFHTLYEMGCDQFQGFFFSRPVNVDGASNVLTRRPQSLLHSRNLGTGTDGVASAVLPFRTLSTPGRRRG